MSVTKYDYLIIGQGLAGSILAYRLIKCGKTALVIDNEHATSSSKVAAGIINPITGHRLNITAGFEQYQPIAECCYTEMEEEFEVSLYKNVAQSRLIKNQGQFDYLQHRQQQGEYVDLLGEHEFASSYFCDNEFGSIKIKRSAVVDCKNLLTACKAWLCAQDSYLATKFDYAELSQSELGIEYKNVCGNRLIFCEGYAAVHNPWLLDLPFKPAKGEILSIKLDDESTQTASMLNWGNWLAPTSEPNVAKLGSSFEWADLSLTPSLATTEKLLDSLHTNTHAHGQVIATEVGIRPTTRERLPFIGQVGTLKNAYCFNGFGSKGCLLIPHYANLLCAHLIEGSALPEEVTKWL